MLFKGLNNVLFSITFTVPHKEREDEWFVAGTLEVVHPLHASIHTILYVGEGVAVHGRVVLIEAAQKRNVGAHIRGEVAHNRLPRLGSIGVGTARELHMQKHQVPEDDTEGVGTPIHVASLLGHIDHDPCALDVIVAMVKRRI